jgi:hypothetical protein
VASRSASPQSGGNSISAGCPYGFKLSFYKQGLFAIFKKIVAQAAAKMEVLNPIH